MDGTKVGSPEVSPELRKCNGHKIQNFQRSLRINTKEVVETACVRAVVELSTCIGACYIKL